VHKWTYAGGVWPYAVSVTAVPVVVIGDENVGCAPPNLKMEQPMQRRHIQQTTTLEHRLLEEAGRLRKEARGTRQAMCAAVSACRARRISRSRSMCRNG
jgi:hypothetical protein